KQILNRSPALIMVVVGEGADEPFDMPEDIHGDALPGSAQRLTVQAAGTDGFPSVFATIPRRDLADCGEREMLDGILRAERAEHMGGILRGWFGGGGRLFRKKGFPPRHTPKAVDGLKSPAEVGVLADREERALPARVTAFARKEPILPRESKP